MADAAPQDFKAFLKERKTPHKQRSQGWLASRAYTIGASEVSALTGKKFLQQPVQDVKEKGFG